MQRGDVDRLGVDRRLGRDAEAGPEGGEVEPVAPGLAAQLELEDGRAERRPRRRRPWRPGAGSGRRRRGFGRLGPDLADQADALLAVEPARRLAASTPSGRSHSHIRASWSRGTLPITFVFGCAGGMPAPASAVNRSERRSSRPSSKVSSATVSAPTSSAADDPGHVVDASGPAVGRLDLGAVEQGELVDLGRRRGRRGRSGPGSSAWTVGSALQGVEQGLAVADRPDELDVLDRGRRRRAGRPAGRGPRRRRPRRSRPSRAAYRLRAATAAASSASQSRQKPEVAVGGGAGDGVGRERLERRRRPTTRALRSAQPSASSNRARASPERPSGAGERASGFFSQGEIAGFAFERPQGARQSPGRARRRRRAPGRAAGAAGRRGPRRPRRGTRRRP